MVDFKSIIRTYPGRIGLADCRPGCNREPFQCCPPGQWLAMVPGESAFYADLGFQTAYDGKRGIDALWCEGREHCLGSLRPIICRTYPIHPGRFGLMVDTRCPEHKWLSVQFIMECERIWKEVMDDGPECQQWVNKLWEIGWSGEPCVAVWDLKRDFDPEYVKRFGQWARPDWRGRVMDSGWVKPGDRVLDVGGANGEGATILRERGVLAHVVDANPSLVNGACSWVGDVRALPFAESSYNVALCIDVLEHLDEYEKALGELFRVSSDRVIVYVAPLEESDNLLLDPTHRVFLPWQRWLEVFGKYGDLVNVDYSHYGALLVKR